MVGAHNPKFYRFVLYAASMVSFLMALWDEAGSGGEETRMRRGLTSDEWSDEKNRSLR